MEPLNVVFILLTLWLTGRFLMEVNRLMAACLSAILLAQCRYESIIFITGWVSVTLFVVLYEAGLFTQRSPVRFCYLWQNRIFETGVRVANGGSEECG